MAEAKSACPILLSINAVASWAMRSPVFQGELS
jgi:hypothetical protein